MTWCMLAIQAMENFAATNTWQWWLWNIYANVMSYLMLDCTSTFSSDLTDFFRKNIALDHFMRDIV